MGGSAAGRGDRRRSNKTGAGTARRPLASVPRAQHAVLPQPGARAQLAAGSPGVAAALALPAGAVPLRQARGAAVPSAGPAAGALRLVRAGAALLPRARAAAGAAQPAPSRAAGLPPALLPLLLALLLQVPPGAPLEAASTCPSAGAEGGVRWARRSGRRREGAGARRGGDALRAFQQRERGFAMPERSLERNESKRYAEERAKPSVRAGRAWGGPEGRTAAAVPLARSGTAAAVSPGL